MISKSHHGCRSALFMLCIALHVYVYFSIKCIMLYAVHTFLTFVWWTKVQRAFCVRSVCSYFSEQHIQSNNQNLRHFQYKCFVDLSLGNARINGIKGIVSFFQRNSTFYIPRAPPPPFPSPLKELFFISGRGGNPSHH